MGQPFGGTDGKLQPLVAGRPRGRVDHGWRGIDACQSAGLWPLPCQLPQQISGTAADIEHSLGRGTHRDGEGRGPVGDLVVQAAEPALLVRGGSLLKGRNIPVRWHSNSLAGKPRLSDPR